LKLKTSLEGQTAVVAGGASGIGAACAKSIAANGAHVVILDKDLDRAKLIANEIKADGGQAEGIYLDVTSSDEVKKTIAGILAAHKKI